MPYDLDIPGQVGLFELRAIEIVAGLVPPKGIMVEVGSLYGLSSSAWAASVPDDAEVHCIDPWPGDRSVRVTSKKTETTNSLEGFLDNTKAYKNIVAHQGYSPRDFMDWNRPIDLFSEDSVHHNPILRQNLQFWASHLKPTGVACGDDFRPRCPDVMSEVRDLAKSLNRELIVVDFFWCLLPPADLVPAAAAVRQKLLALRDEAVAAASVNPLAFSFKLKDRPKRLAPSQNLDLTAKICNSSLEVWRDRDGRPLSGSINLEVRAATGERPYQNLFSVADAFHPDITITTKISASMAGLAPGQYTASVNLLLVDAAGVPVHTFPPSARWAVEVGATS